ncbi:MAG: hypothetical protein U0166_02730 [Acidobacteriota bacterium]
MKQDHGSGWFGVSKPGLEKLLGGKNRAFILHELFQNACDEDVTRIDINVIPIAGRTAFRIQVEDDVPEGWRDIEHAYILFAESDKKRDPTKRGRFNLGEKLVLAACESATIVTTKGSVAFESDGATRRTLRERGSAARSSTPSSRGRGSRWRR